MSALDAVTSSLAIAVGRVEGTVVLTLRGRFGPGDADTVAWMLEDLIEAQGNLSVAVDLTRVVHLDRAGAQVLVASAEAARRHGGTLRLSTPSPTIRPTVVGGRKTRSRPLASVPS